MIRKLIFITAILMTALAGEAQELWTSAAFKTGFGKNWSVGAEAEYRTHNALKSSERFTVGASGEFKQKYYKIDAGYKFIDSHTLGETTRKGNYIPPYWIGRHRIYASATGKLKLGRFELSLRERYQFTHRVGKWVPKFEPDMETPKSDEWVAPKDKHVLRSRLACEYSKKKLRFTPYASVELYNMLNSGFSVEKIRYTIGSEYKINRHNRVELFYRFVQSVEEGAKNYNVIGVGYTFKL